MSLLCMLQLTNQVLRIFFYFKKKDEFDPLLEKVRCIQGKHIVKDQQNFDSHFCGFLVIFNRKNSNCHRWRLTPVVGLTPTCTNLIGF